MSGWDGVYDLTKGDPELLQVQALHDLVDALEEALRRAEPSAAMEEYVVEAAGYIAGLLDGYEPLGGPPLPDMARMDDWELLVLAIQRTAAAVGQGDSEADDLLAAMACLRVVWERHYSDAADGAGS